MPLVATASEQQLPVEAAVVGVKQNYESIALYKDILENVNMSTLNTEIGSKETGGAITLKQFKLKLDIHFNTAFKSYQAPLPISGEHQPLLAP